MFFGQYLLEKGAISKHALLDALSRQRELNLSLEELAAREGLLDEEQARAVAAEYRSSRKGVEQILLDRGLLAQADIRRLQDLQAARRARIGTILVEAGHLQPAGLNEHLAAYQALEDQRRRNLETDFAQLERGEVIQAFLDLTVFHLERALGSAVKLESISEEHRPSGPAESRFLQRLYGDLDLWFALDIPEPLTGKVGTQMLGIPVEEGSELSHDAVRELVNLISGNACVQLERQDLRLKPDAPGGADLQPAADAVKASSHSVLASGSGELHVHLFFCHGAERGC
jgi:CheY-specific phosphatase CheX